MKKNRLLLGALALGLSATTFAQPEKYVVIEENTGTWCGWCPLGTVAFENLEDDEDKFIGIAVHAGDPMENSYYADQSSSFPGVSGYPSAVLERMEADHAAYSETMFASRENETPVAEVVVGGYVTGDELEIRILAEFAEQVSGDWRLAAVVTEDNVTGSSGGYAQANYFAGGGSGSLVGNDWDWADKPNPVPASEMVYNHVARLIADDAYDGVAGSVPSSVNAGDRVWYSYYVDIDPSWDLSNIHVVAMLLEPSGVVNNAGKGGVEDGWVGTVGIEEDATNNFSINAYPNPATDFVNVTLELNEAAAVTVEVVNLVGATVATMGTDNLASGTHYNTLDMSEFANGVYFIKTTVNEQVEMTKISVQK